MIAYGRTKLANILFVKQLQKRMDADDIKGIAVSLHPGTVRTQISRNLGWKLLLLEYLLTPLKLLTFKSPLQGCQTTLYTVFEDASKLKKGGYYSDCKQINES